MRVVAGELRGRRFDGPDGYETRPTTDRVREATFNALNSRNLIREAKVADLFAGSGGLGIEALSRGAAHCIFVENNRTTLRVLRSNLQSLGLDRCSTVIAGDATAISHTLDVDIVLADPPYDFEGWPNLLTALAAPFVVAESDHAIAAVDPWQSTRSRRYGRSWITFLEQTEKSSVPAV